MIQIQYIISRLLRWLIRRAGHLLFVSFITTDASEPVGLSKARCFLSCDTIHHDAHMTFPHRPGLLGYLVPWSGRNSVLLTRHKQTQQHMPEQRSCLQPWPNMEKPVSKTTSSPSSMHSLCVKKGFSYKCIKNLGYICACISLMFALKRLWC